MKAEYFESEDDVLFINPITRFLSKIFGPKPFVIKCSICNKIPTDIYGDRCKDHIKK